MLDEALQDIEGIAAILRRMPVEDASRVRRLLLYLIPPALARLEQYGLWPEDEEALKRLESILREEEETP